MIISNETECMNCESVPEKDVAHGCTTKCVVIVKLYHQQPISSLVSRLFRMNSDIATRCIFYNYVYDYTFYDYNYVFILREYI